MELYLICWQHGHGLNALKDLSEVTLCAQQKHVECNCLRCSGIGPGQISAALHRNTGQPT
jgi:hypothetical protein